jgi:hypothetical protein
MTRWTVTRAGRLGTTYDKACIMMKREVVAVLAARSPSAGSGIANAVVGPPGVNGPGLTAVRQRMEPHDRDHRSRGPDRRRTPASSDRRRLEW